MSGPYKDQTVSLQRDTLSLPWGFRLQGGKDFKAPLTIQRVFVGSPADGVVHRGDVLVAIENHDTTNLSHKQAQDIIKQAGGQLRMHVRRGSSYVTTRPVPPPAPSVTLQGYRGPGKPGPIPAAGALAFVPKPKAPMPASSNAPSFGHDYSKGGRYPKKNVASPGNMLSRVQRSLNDAIWQPGAFDEQGDPDYEYRNVHDLRSQFVEPPQQPAYGGAYGQQQHSSPPRRGQQGARPFARSRSGGAGGGGRSPQKPQPVMTIAPKPNFNNAEEEDYSQKSVHDLLGVFTDKPERREYSPRRRRTSLPPAWRNYYHHVPAPESAQQLEEDEDYEHIPVKELKKKFGKKPGSDSKPRRQRKEKAPHHIALSGQEGEDTQGGVGTGKRWVPPNPDKFGGKPMYQPGWSPKQPQPQAPQAGWQSVKPPTMHGLPAPSGPPPPTIKQPYQVPRVEEPDIPAWSGSLRSGGGVRPWEVASSRSAAPVNVMNAPAQPARRASPQPQASPRAVQQMPSPQAQQQRARSPRPRTRPEEPPAVGSVPVHQPMVQKMTYGPDGSQTYSQHGANDYDGDAKIAHLQYNTPLGLYSRDNVEEALTGQTAGTAGEGTMQVTGGGPPGQKQFDPKQSSVLRMLQEQEGGGRTRGPAQPQQQAAEQSARYVDHAQGQEMQYQGYMDHYKQSPSMHALACNMSSMAVEPSGTGTSDF